MGRWRGGETDDLAYVQFLEATGDADDIVVLSLIRSKGTLFAKIIVHRLSNEFLLEGEVPRYARLEFEAGEEERSLALIDTGFIVRDSAGGLVFTSGDGRYDDKLTPIQNVLQRLTHELEIRIDGCQMLFPVSETDRSLIWNCFSVS